VKYNLILTHEKLFFAFLLLCTQVCESQQIRFNDELDKFCKHSLKQTSIISSERKAILDGIAAQLSSKKYVLFTCQTNSRRTLLLQIWAQTAFNYFGLYDKYAGSIGDTVTSVYPEVVNVLQQSGFYCTKLDNAEPNGYLISVGKEYPENIILSKKDLGTINTFKGLVIKVCYENEKSSLAEGVAHIDLPYQSPISFEKTPQEKEKYNELNKQVAIEMLYLAKKTKELVFKKENTFE
jgi:arsenate reductase